MEELLPYVAEQALVDHHCHGVLRRDADLATLESMLTEGDSWPGGSVFDSRAPALLAEALELTPFGKFLYSSDAFGLPELYYLGSALFRSALSAYLRTGLDQDIFTERAATRITRMLSADNAKRAYQLGDQM